MFYITLHNNRMNQYRHPAEDMIIDSYELSPCKSRQEIEDWVLRANNLLRSTFNASDLYLSWIRKRCSYAKYQKARYALICANPGFSEAIYDKEH